MKKNSCLSVVLALLAAIGSASGASAQASSGSIRGTVLDPSGALIPHAQITVANADGFSRTYESDSTGAFDASQLPAGSYSVSVSAQGFTSALKDVDVTDDEVIREDVKLGITVDQEIEVFAK